MENNYAQLCELQLVHSFELLLQQKVLQNLDYFNLKTEIGFERVFNNKEFDLDYHFLPKNLTTEVSPLKNEIMFDMPELIDSFIESTLPVQELLGPITMTLSKDDQIKSEISTNVLTQVEETTQIPQTAIEDFLNDKSKEIVPKFVRSVYAEYNDKHIIPKINLSFRPFSMNIVPAKLHPIEMLYPTKDFNDIAEPIIIYSPPGNGKTKFMIDNKLESVLVDTDYYRSEYKDGALIYDLLRHGRSVITNHIEFLPYFAAKYPILAIVPRTKTVTIARMYSKLSRRQTIETVTEWSEGVYKDLEKLNIFKDIQLKIIELDDSEYISTISEKVIREALKLRFKDLRLRINDWKRLNYKISSYKED